MSEKLFHRLFLIVQIATVAVFWGRAWQHLYWDAPYRTLLWDENWMRWLVENMFQTSWNDYVSTSDGAIRVFIRSVGWFYVLCGFGAIFIKKIPRLVVPMLYMGSAGLILLAALYGKEKFFHLGQFLEYTLQWASPLFLMILWQKEAFTKKLTRWMKLAIALTFVCHGLYAIGYYPRPVGFLEMTMNILHLGDQQAIIFLKIAGVLDFIAAVLIFLPGKMGVAGLVYCVFWGFFTTIARIWAHFYIEFFPNFLLQWLHESILRFPHFLIPLAVLLWQMASNREDFRQLE